MKKSRNNGITLIALIITIVVMLILVVVSVRIALDTGLFETAGNATKNWAEAQDREEDLSSGKVTIGGTTYNSIEEYTNLISGGKAEVDFEKLFQIAEKHPEQVKNNDIGIAEDGSIVNLDLWIYEESTVTENGWDLGGNSYDGYSSYDKEKIIDGKIIGQVPMYIKKDTEDKFYPVIEMNDTFYNCEELVTAPTIPSSVTSMVSTFSGCTSLTEAPKIPNLVTSLYLTFSDCKLLKRAPEIPSYVIDMSHTFEGCEALQEAPTIPGQVVEMVGTFDGCVSLTGTIVINASNIKTIDIASSNYIFDGITNNITVKVPANSKTYDEFYEVYGDSENITIETY